VLNKLDYLQQLGVTALFFNPLNNAPSLHKYDARHYHHIDVSFGSDPVGDLKRIARESVSGHPYEGQLNPGAKAHVLAVTRRWLAPEAT
jgi:hypothetical protein